MLCAWLYGIVTHCDGERLAVLLFTVGTKMIDAFSDVFEGQLQKEHRLDLAGISMSTRMLISTVVCLAVLIITKKLIVACMCMFLGAALCMLLFSAMPAVCVHHQHNIQNQQKVSFRRSMTIFSPAIPLFLSSFGLMMISGMPKYIIDFLMTESDQAIYGILYLPAQVISLLSSFIFKPLIGEMAYDWKHKQNRNFILRVNKLLWFIATGDAVVLLGAWLLGIPILSLLSGLKLDSYLVNLLILVVGGAFTAIAALLFQAITIMHYQTVAFGIYLIVIVISIVLDLILIRTIGLLGASIGYMVQMMLLAICLYGVYCIGRSGKLKRYRAYP